MVSVPWVTDRVCYKTLFETRVLYWLKDSPVPAVAEKMRISRNTASSIMEHAIARRKGQAVAHLGVGVTSSGKGHKYVTVVSDTKTGTVLYGGEHRKKEMLKSWFTSLTETQLGR